jgi:hypothetical protein
MLYVVLDAKLSSSVFLSSHILRSQNGRAGPPSEDDPRDFVFLVSRYFRNVQSVRRPDKLATTLSPIQRDSALIIGRTPPFASAEKLRQDALIAITKCQFCLEASEPVIR